MNVDLQWCPCGKQARENDLFCSDICHLLEQYPGARKNPEEQVSTENKASRITRKRQMTVTPLGAIPITPSRLTFRSRQKLYNQCYNKVCNNLSTSDYFNQKPRFEIRDQKKLLKLNSKNISRVGQSLKRNTVSHSNNISTRIVNSYAEKSQDQPLIVY